MKKSAIIITGLTLAVPPSASAARLTVREVSRAAAAYANADIRDGFAAGYRVSDCKFIRRGVGRCTLDESIPQYGDGATLRTWVTIRRDRFGRLQVRDSLFQS